VVVLKPDEKWSGAHGFITQAIAQDHPDARNVSAYLCGHPQMIADVSTVLVQQGCIKDRIYTEKY
jgi:CDP-4-dehydro-6-deoxyglucose reductase, E3